MNPLGPKHPSSPSSNKLENWGGAIGNWLSALATLDFTGCLPQNDARLTHAIFKTDTPTQVKTSMIPLIRELLGSENWSSLIDTSQNGSIEDIQRQFSMKLIESLRLSTMPISLHSIIIRDYTSKDTVPFTLGLHRFTQAQFYNCSFPSQSIMPEGLYDCEFIKCNLSKTNFSDSSGTIKIDGGKIQGMKVPEGGLVIEYTKNTPLLCDDKTLQTLFEKLPPTIRKDYLSLFQTCDKRISEGTPLAKILQEHGMQSQALFRLWQQHYEHPLKELYTQLPESMKATNIIRLFLLSFEHPAQNLTELLSGDDGKGGSTGDQVATTIVEICHEALHTTPKIFQTTIMYEHYQSIPTYRKQSELSSLLQIDEMLNQSNYNHDYQSNPSISSAIAYLKTIHTSDPQKMMLLKVLGASLT